MAITFESSTLPGHLTVNNGSRRRFFSIADMDVLPAENSVLLVQDEKEMRITPDEVDGAGNVSDVIQAIVTGAGG